MSKNCVLAHSRTIIDFSRYICSTVIYIKTPFIYKQNVTQYFFQMFEFTIKLFNHLLALMFFIVLKGVSSPCQILSRSIWNEHKCDNYNWKIIIYTQLLAHCFNQVLTNFKDCFNLINRKNWIVNYFNCLQILLSSRWMILFYSQLIFLSVLLKY